MIYIFYIIIVVSLLWFVYKAWLFSIIFHPKKVRQLDSFSDAYKFVSIQTQDGAMLEGCVYTPIQKKKTFLYFGGRGQDSVGLLPKLAESFPKCQIITFNYRGYGNSTSKPTKEHLLEDAKEVVAIIQKHYSVDAIVGYSLGSSIASYAISETSIKKLVLIGAFFSIQDVIKQRFGFTLPFFNYNFHTCNYLQNVSSDILLINSKNDIIVPFKSVEKLQQCHPSITSFFYQNATHIEILWNEKTKEIVENFLDC